MRRRRHRFRDWGMAEFLGIFLILLSLVIGILWGLSQVGAQWETTTGSVLHCDIVETHYNAEPNTTKVILEYEYVVNDRAYRTLWQGIWPKIADTDALPREHLNELQTEGYMVTVFYNPVNPWESRLHVPSHLMRLWWGISFIGISGSVILYFLYLYPRLRVRI